MGLFMTLEADGEDAVRPRAKRVPAMPAVFDLHCDTLDGWRSTATPVLAACRATRDPRAPHGHVADNDAHVRCAYGRFAWCRCFAAFIPDEARRRGLDAVPARAVRAGARAGTLRR
ncbi:MAG: hypothetical protein ACLT98_15625 [Eggerthellaceae bacterium]